MPQRYDAPNGDPDPGDESAQDLAALSNHIGEWWGEGNVWHELVSEYVHIDVHSIPPSDAHPYHVLITTGMSDRPMEGAIGNGQHCELMLSLPADWPLDQASLSIPIRCHEGARKINIRANKEVHFFSLIPLYEAELKFAREHGTPKLFERLDEAGVDELVVVGRPCVITGHRPTRAPTIIPLSLFNRLFRRWLKT
jgi:hypothetical protein